MLRTALAAGDSDLARRLADGIEPRYPAVSTPSAPRAPLAEHAGGFAGRRPSTPKQLRAGSSSETPRVRLRFSARAAVWSPVRTARLSNHFGTPPICSARWSTAPLSLRRKRSSSKRTRCSPRTGERS
jgi:hypothetical protein